MILIIFIKDNIKESMKISQFKMILIKLNIFVIFNNLKKLRFSIKK